MSIEFNPHQYRLWEDMLQSIKAFRHGEINYASLVGALVAPMQVGEFRNQELVDQWLDLWMPLDIMLAVRIDDGTIDEIRLEEIETNLKKFEIFLHSVYETVEKPFESKFWE